LKSSYILLIAAFGGTLVVYLLPPLPGHAHLVLQSAWILGVWLVLTWKVAWLLANNTHLLAARLGWRTAKAPAIYVRALFDDYAERFDQHLMVDLAYAAPNRVRSMIDPYLDSVMPTVVDLGCGTGICGPLFRPLTERLIGVDLSPGMLEVAEKRKIYDALVEADIVVYLGRHRHAFDCCFAADVLVYLGDLRPLLMAAAIALRPGAYLAFTVESATQGDWILQRTGRYAHSRDYVRTLAQQCGFQIVALEPAILRTQGDEPVIGDVWLMQRLAA
jgi:predicted TPR repeat methyltransferase